MLKKMLLSVGLIGVLTAANLNLDISKLFQNSKPWTVSMKSGGTYYMVSPLDINFSQLQKLLTTNNQAIYVYTFYQRPDLAAVDFGLKIFGAIKITKDKIVWAEFYKSDKPTTIFDNYEDFKNDMLSHANEVTTNNNARNVFKNSYVPNFEKIKANKIYLIMPSNVNLSLNFNMNIKNSSGISGGILEGNNNTQNELENNTNSNSSGISGGILEGNNNTQNELENNTNSNSSIVYPPTPGINSNEDLQTPPSPSLNNAK